MYVFVLLIANRNCLELSFACVGLLGSKLSYWVLLGLVEESWLDICVSLQEIKKAIGVAAKKIIKKAYWVFFS